MEKDKRLMEASCSDERAMLSKSLIQFSVHGVTVFDPLLFDLRPNYGGGNEDNIKIKVC